MELPACELQLPRLRQLLRYASGERLRLRADRCARLVEEAAVFRKCRCGDVLRGAGLSGAWARAVHLPAWAWALATTATATAPMQGHDQNEAHRLSRKQAPGRTRSRRTRPA